MNKIILINKQTFICCNCKNVKSDYSYVYNITSMWVDFRLYILKLRNFNFCAFPTNKLQTLYALVFPRNVFLLVFVRIDV